MRNLVGILILLIACILSVSGCNFIKFVLNKWVYLYRYIAVKVYQNVQFVWIIVQFKNAIAQTKWVTCLQLLLVQSKRRAQKVAPIAYLNVQSIWSSDHLRQPNARRNNSQPIFESVPYIIRNVLCHFSNLLWWFYQIYMMNIFVMYNAAKHSSEKSHTLLMHSFLQPHMVTTSIF